MAHDFDPGYCAPAFQQLVRDYPDEQVYPFKDFRTEWGPIFHRGRLDGSARVLILGQDPAQHETVARRILVGEAGQRIQGFLTKLGMDRSYVMINTFLYSVYGQAGGDKHKNDAGIIAYRNRWLDALLVGTNVEAVVALGGLADGAWTKWKATASGAAFTGAYRKILHPTFPESSGSKVANTKKMLLDWNAALQALRPAIAHPDAVRPLVLYGDKFLPAELVEILEDDLPPGIPDWMRGAKKWADRIGAGKAKRANITITAPDSALP
jgi:hypothetical protein